MPETSKLDSIVHYICARCDDPSKLGATKLNKILFYTDLLSYLSDGKAITGSKYIKLQFGPVPKTILQTVNNLQAARKISVAAGDYHGFQKTNYSSLCEPDLTMLEKNEIDLINMVMNHICNGHTATSISEASHDVVWKAAATGEEIPLNAFLAAKPGNITPADMSWADAVIENRAA